MTGTTLLVSLIKEKKCLYGCLSEQTFENFESSRKDGQRKEMRMFIKIKYSFVT